MTLSFDYIVDFFAEHAAKGLLNLVYVANYFCYIFGILKLTTNWASYEGEIRMSKMFELIIKFSTIQFCIRCWDWFTTATYETLAKAGMLAATGNGDMEIFKPSSIYNMGMKISDALWISWQKTSFINNTQAWFILVICAIAVLLAYWYIAFQVMLTKIIYYVISLVGIILLPFGLIDSLKSYYQKATGGVINLGIRIMVTYFMIGTISKFTDKLIIKVSKSVSIDIIHEALVVVALGYLTYKIPEMASDILSGNPTFGSGATAAVGGAIGGFAGSMAGKITPQNAATVAGNFVRGAQGGIDYANQMNSLSNNPNNMGKAASVGAKVLAGTVGAVANTVVQPLERVAKKNYDIAAAAYSGISLEELQRRRNEKANKGK